MKAAPLLLVLCLFGCQKPEAQPEPAAPVAKANPTATAPAAGGGGNTIRQVTPTNVGGITPVTGTESLEGASSAAGQVLKEKAKNLPGAVNNPNPTAPPAEGDQASGN